MATFSGESLQPEPYSESLVNRLRGKSLLMEHEAGCDIRTLCRMIDWFCETLDNDDGEEAWGENGWRVRFDIPDDDE